MTNNEERREVAKRLRNVSGTPEWATAACCIAECLGEYDYPLWEDSKPLFNRLADLIEPEPGRTCLPMVGWRCSACHTVSRTTDREPKPKYCPNCGAKAVK